MIEYKWSDGGRDAAGFKPVGWGGDCATRAVALIHTMGVGDGKIYDYVAARMTLLMVGQGMRQPTRLTLLLLNCASVLASGSRRRVC